MSLIPQMTPSSETFNCTLYGSPRRAFSATSRCDQLIPYHNIYGIIFLLEIVLRQISGFWDCSHTGDTLTRLPNNLFLQGNARVPTVRLRQCAFPRTLITLQRVSALHCSRRRKLSLGVGICQDSAP
jgi:hypothetical protein